MQALQLPTSVQERLLSDNLFSKERAEKASPTLVNEKRKSVLKELSKNSELNYEETVRFYLRVVRSRNLFLHEGNKWAIPESMAGDCMEEIWPLTNLYVKLHNRFISAHYSADRRITGPRLDKLFEQTVLY